MFAFFTQFFQNLMVLLGYVVNPNTFPNPLSAKEEQELLLALKNGDEEARNTLIERNMRLVAFVARRYYQCGKEIDDLISIGTIGLIKAIGSFDMEKGIRLATYAVRCIENEILMCLRSEKKLVNEVSINEPIGFDYEGNEINLMDILTDGEESVFKEVNLKMRIAKLYEAIEKELTPRERKIIELRYALLCGKPKTQREIAKMMRISRSYVYGVWYCKQEIETLETTGFASLTVFGDMTPLNVSREWIKVFKNALNKEKRPIGITKLKKQRPFIFLEQE